MEVSAFAVDQMLMEQYGWRYSLLEEHLELVNVGEVPIPCIQKYTVQNEYSRIRIFEKFHPLPGLRSNHFLLRLRKYVPNHLD